MAKKIILSVFSLIFIIVSAVLIGWIIKQEKNKSGQESEKISNAYQEIRDQGENNLPQADTKIENKSDADKAVKDIDSMANSLENESEE